MANIEQITRLALYETKAVVPVQSFPAGVYQFPLHVMGNSLLSSLWVKSAGGATINVRYWDYGAGDNQYPGERVDLKAHTTVTTSDITERIIVTALHDKPRIEIEITGGTAELGVYVTVVASFASDLDASLKLHLEDADILKDKGLVVSGYDATLDKFFMLPIENGGVKINGTINASINPVSSPAIINQTIAAATETALAIPSLTSRFTLTARTGSLRVAWAIGQTATNYLTVYAGGVYEQDRLDKNSSFTIYLYSPNGTTIELETWQ